MEESKIFQVACEISKIQTLVDRGIQIKIETGELSPEDTAKLFNLKKPETVVYVAFADMPLQEKDLKIPDIEPEFKNDKSPSQRLRNILFIYWQQNKKEMDFEMFYRRQVDKWINTIKEKLN